MMLAVKNGPEGLLKSTYTFLMLRSTVLLTCCLVGTMMIVLLYGNSERLLFGSTESVLSGNSERAEESTSYEYSVDIGILTSGEMTQGEKWASRYQELISDDKRDSLVIQNRTNGCQFDKCEHAPYVYFLIPFRNRGESLRRLADTLQIDAESAQTTSIHCLCLGVADYDDVVDDSMRSTEALEHWGGSYDIKSIKGPFSRGGGIQALLKPEPIITTKDDDSLYYIIDTDMVVWPGFIDDVIAKNQLQSGTVPVCWSLDSYSRETAAGTDGFWRGYGMGMWSLYASTLKRVTHYNIAGADKHDWGLEDYAIQKQLRYGTSNLYRYNTNMKRYCNPYLFHFPHPKILWEESINGMATDEDAKEPNPFTPEASVKFILSMYEETYFNLNKFGDDQDQCKKFLTLTKNNWKFQSFQRR